MSAEVKRYSFGYDSKMIENERGSYVKYVDYESLRRATVSMEVAQKLADELLRCQTALDSLYQHNAAVRQAVAHHYGVRHNKEIFAALNKEKGGQG